MMTMRKNNPLGQLSIERLTVSLKSKVRSNAHTAYNQLHFFWIYSPSLHLLVEVLRDINRNWSFMLDKEVDINELEIPCTTLVWSWPISSLLSWIQ
jgi:hypothetical protein